MDQRGSSRYKDKNIFPRISNRAIEVIFWLTIVSITIFLNLSSQIFLKTRPIFIIIFISTILIIILSRIWRHIQPTIKKVTFLLAFSLIVLIPFLLIRTKFAQLIIFYYLPTVTAISMAFLVIIEPRIHTIILVGLCMFFLGEAFFGIYVGTEGGIKYPIMFFRIFSLTLLTMFTYYLYNKETSLRTEVDAFNKKLEELNRMKSNFLANVSHELRTPLTSIRNATILFKKKIDKQNAEISISDHELLDIIISNVDRQGRLIDDILDLDKIERGRVDIVRFLVDIGKIAKGVLNSMPMQATEKNIKIIADIPDNLPKIWASESRLAEVYTNLIDNAIKYNKQNGKVTLQIKVVGDNIESVVEDTGIGISSEELDALFDKFRRLQDFREYKNKKIGLGLVITKEIIELHGGRIWVESKLGVGTKFTFTLPQGLRKRDRGG